MRDPYPIKVLVAPGKTVPITSLPDEEQAQIEKQMRLVSEIEGAHMSNKLIVFEENAGKFSEWLKTRGGLAVWRSIDLSDPGTSCTTPALTNTGTPSNKPHWKYGDKPERIITDASEVEVQRMVEVKRFHVAVKPGGGFMQMVLTDAGTARVRREVEKAGKGSSYIFDYGDYNNCVIIKPDKVQPLPEWEAEHLKPQLTA